MAALPFALLALAAAPAFAYPAFPANEDFTTVAAWAARRTDIPRGDLIDVRDGVAFVVLPAVAATGPRAIRIEALDAQAWRRIGGRSADVHGALDCDPPTLILGSVDRYAASNRLGEVQRGLSPEVLKLSPATLTIVAAALCTPSIQARQLAVATLESSTPPPGPVQLAAADEPAPIIATPAPEQPTRGARADGSIAAQVGAFSTAAAAGDALGELGTGGLALERRVELGQQDGRAVYRALLSGFPTSRAASAFCRRLARLGHGCVVLGRRHSARPASIREAAPSAP